MKKNEIKYILKRCARVIYSNSSTIYDDIQKVKPYLNQLHAGYEYFAEAILESVQNHREESLLICDKSLDFAFQQNDIELILELSMFMGILNRSIGRREEALKNYLTALKYEVNPRCYNNIADIYLFYGDYEEARRYLVMALDLLDEDASLTDFEHRLLTTIYINLSEAEIKSGKADAGITSAEKCIKMSEEVNDVFGLASGYYLLALAYTYKKDYPSALGHVGKSLDLYINCDAYSQSRVFDYIEDNIRLQARILNEWGKYQESLDKLLSLRHHVKMDYQLILSNTEALGDDQATNHYYKAFMNYLKVEEDNEQTSKINFLKSQIRVHETEKKANNYELLYNHTKSIASIGRDIIASEKLDDVLIALSGQIGKIMDFDSLLLAEVVGDKIKYNWAVDESDKAALFTVDISDENSFSSWVVRNNQSMRINNTTTEEELAEYKKDYKPTFYGRKMDALVICPIAYKDTVYGLLNVQSLASYSYTDYDLEVLKMLASFIGVAMRNWQDTEELKELNGRLDNLSKTDALTGISNRHVLSEIVEDIFSKDSPHKSITVVMIDIDYFKEYNDTYGHIEGDQCLIALVDAMKPFLDTGENRLFRYGGDEFAAIIPDNSPSQVKALLELVQTSVENLEIENNKSKTSDYVTCSIGYTTVSAGYEYQKAFYLADEALYISKGKGKNQISFVDAK